MHQYVDKVRDTLVSAEAVARGRSKYLGKIAVKQLLNRVRAAVLWVQPRASQSPRGGYYTRGYYTRVSSSSSRVVHCTWVQLS